VLVVDDIEDNREIYSTYLVREGYRVVEATGGEAAIALAADLAPDAIIMDLAMPFVDGWAATRAIRALPGGKDIYIVVVSGHDTRESRQAAVEAGCDDFVAKPCIPSDLEQKLSAALARKS